jgi:hypothetical protein
VGGRYDRSRIGARRETMDLAGDIVVWVIGAAIAIAIAVGVLWLIFRYVLEPRPRDRGDR